MFKHAFKFSCRVLLLLLLTQFVYASDCVSPELTAKIEEAIGASTKLLTGGRHIEQETT